LSIEPFYQREKEGRKIPRFIPTILSFSSFLSVYLSVPRFIPTILSFSLFLSLFLFKQFVCLFDCLCLLVYLSGSYLQFFRSLLFFLSVCLCLFVYSMVQTYNSFFLFFSFSVSVQTGYLSICLSTWIFYMVHTYNSFFLFFSFCMYVYVHLCVPWFIPTILSFSSFLSVLLFKRFVCLFVCLLVYSMVHTYNSFFIFFSFCRSVGMSLNKQLVHLFVCSLVQTYNSFFLMFSSCLFVCSRVLSVNSNNLFVFFIFVLEFYMVHTYNSFFLLFSFCLFV